jgi:hypothetical protein
MVILVAAILSTGVYFALNGTGQTAGTFDQGNHTGLQNGTGTVLLGDGFNGGLHRGDNAGENSGAAWLDILKNLSVVLIATLAVALIRQIMVSQKKALQITEIR